MTSEPPAQPPAAPETDVSARLTTRERHDLATCWNDAEGRHREARWDEVLYRVERIVAERVRVVEGERDAARASLRLSMTSLTSACDFLLKASGLPADTDDIDLIEETVLGRIVRAESAEAAHAAMVKVLGEYFDFDVDPWDDHDAACPAPEDVWRLHRDLRALLAGGEER